MRPGRAIGVTAGDGPLVRCIAAPSLTPVPGGPADPAVRATVGPPTTTDINEFGTIFDALPPSFPKLPGQEPAETGAGPTSGSFAVEPDRGGRQPAISRRR